MLGALQHVPDRAFLDHVGGRIVELVEIDVVGLQSLQAFVHHPADVIRVEDSFAAVRADHHVAALGRENDFVAPAFERFPSRVSE